MQDPSTWRVAFGPPEPVDRMPEGTTLREAYCEALAQAPWDDAVRQAPDDRTALWIRPPARPGVDAAGRRA